MHKLSSILLTTILSSAAFAAELPAEWAADHKSAAAEEAAPRQASDWRVDSLRWEARLTATAGTGDFSPFWFASNTYGMGSVRPNNIRLQAGIYKDMSQDTRWSWGAGLELAGGIAQQQPFHIQQAYGEIRYRCLDLMIGQKEIPGYGVDPVLSTGNLLYSNNTMPIPQIRAGIFEFADIWGTKGWLGIKGYLAFGKFTDNKWLRDWVEDGAYPQGILYHSKGLWLRNGNPSKFPLTFEVGIEMGTQFGGEAWYWDQTHTKLLHLKAQSGWKGFLKALVPMAADETSIAGEQTNVQGNFVGTWSYALAWTPAADWSIKAYYQHMFEDHSMLYIEYPWKDGLYGVEATLPRNRFVSKVVGEFLYTKDQTSPVYWDKTDKIPEQISGWDHYYAHYIYGAWQNWGRIIGNPMVISPIYNANHSLTLLTNRLWALNLGLSGNPTDELSYVLKMTFSRNWGSYHVPLPEVENNFNFMAEVNWRPLTSVPALRGWEGSLAVGADGGPLLGRSLGFRLSIARTGLIRF